MGSFYKTPVVLAYFLGARYPANAGLRRGLRGSRGASTERTAGYGGGTIGEGKKRAMRIASLNY
jgi:hypothetical protein